MFSFLLHLRHDLDRAAAGTDHRDRFIRVVGVGVPVRRMEEFALEVVEAGDSGR